MAVHAPPHDALRRALVIPDLTDPAHGRHAMQKLLADLLDGLRALWGCAVLVQRGSPAVSTHDNWEALRYPPDAAARDARYTRRIDAGRVLRSHTSAMIPQALRLASEAGLADVLLACPGLVYRRDVIDRLHTGEPHQLDLWRLAPRALGPADLEAMVRAVVSAALPGSALRVLPAVHPYTLQGLEIEVSAAGGWVEVGECGLAHPDVLRGCGLDPESIGGLAMGLGLDRLLMLRKGVDDIRLLRSTDPRIAAQMEDLEPYRPVSSMPPVRRDLSLAVEDELEPEELGDRVRAAVGDRARSLESVEVVAETPCGELPPAARARLGMRPGQKNVLLRVVIRDHERTLTDAEANDLRNEIYAAVHRGDAMEWAT
jgi:phenylalanyl-tRNA synthetase alpha chain